MTASTCSTLPPAIREGKTPPRLPLQQSREGKLARRQQTTSSGCAVTRLQLASTGQEYLRRGVIAGGARTCGAREDMIGLIGGGHPAVTTPPASIRTSVGVRGCTSCSCSSRGGWGCCNGDRATRCSTSCRGGGGRCRSGDGYGGSGWCRGQGSPSFLLRRWQRRSGRPRRVAASSPTTAAHRGEGLEHRRRLLAGRP